MGLFPPEIDEKVIDDIISQQKIKPVWQRDFDRQSLIEIHNGRGYIDCQDFALWDLPMLRRLYGNIYGCNPFNVQELQQLQKDNEVQRGDKVIVFKKDIFHYSIYVNNGFAVSKQGLGGSICLHLWDCYPGYSHTFLRKISAP